MRGHCERVPSRAGRRRRPAARSRARSDLALSSILGFVAAVAAYAVAFTVFMAYGSAPSLTHDDSGNLGARAAGAVEAAAWDPGLAALQGGGNTTNWTSTPDTLVHFGLQSSTSVGMLDPAKLRALSKGNISADPTNGAIDYAEAKVALGLGDYDFHLRTTPLMKTLANAGPTPIGGLRVAYLSNWAQVQTSGPQCCLVDNSYTLTDLGGYVALNVTIHNNGTSDSVFQATFDVPTQREVTDTATTGLLAAGTGTQTVGINLYKTSSWTWDDDDERAIEVTIKDQVKTVASFSVSLAAINMQAGVSPYGFVVESPSKLVYSTTESPAVAVNVYDGTGHKVQNVNVTITDKWASNGTTLLSEMILEKNDAVWHPPKSVTGEYDVAMVVTANTTISTYDRYYTSNTGGGQFTPGPSYAYVEGNDSIAERTMLVDLVQGFRNTTYNNTGGDVYMDFSGVINTDLANNLTSNGQLGNYGALLVGSNADLDSLSSVAAQDAIRNFTLAGGLLVVLGGPAAQTTWLSELLSAGASTSSGGLGSPDPTNPILHAPEELATSRYLGGAASWSLQSADDVHFTHVVLDPANAALDQLDLSRPGDFGNGTVILTSWRAYNLTSPQDKVEAERMLYNFLLHVYGSLYADFGLELPGVSDVASASRTVSASDPLAPGQNVPVRLTIYVFQ